MKRKEYYYDIDSVVDFCRIVTDLLFAGRLVMVESARGRRIYSKNGQRILDFIIKENYWPMTICVTDTTATSVEC